MSPQIKSAINRLSTLFGMWRCIVCLAICVCVAGCESKAYVPTGDDAEHLRKLAVSYMRYVIRHEGQSPPTEKKFKEFITRGGRDPEEIGKFFVSPRDGKAYVVSYNVRITGSSAVVVAYEQDGIDGTRYVAFDSGGVIMADEEQFRRLVPKGLESDAK